MIPSRREPRAIFPIGLVALVAWTACGGGGGAATPSPPPAPDPTTRASGRWSIGPSLTQFEDPMLLAPSREAGAFLLRVRDTNASVGAAVIRSASAWRTAAIGGEVIATTAADGTFDVLTGSGATLFWDRLPEDPAVGNAPRIRWDFGATLPGVGFVADDSRRYLFASGGVVARLGSGFDVAWCRRRLGANWALGGGAVPRLVAAQQVNSGTMQVVALDADSGIATAAEVHWPEAAGFAWAAESADGVLVGNFVQTPLRAVLLDPDLGSQSAWTVERTVATYALDFSRPLGKTRLFGTIHVRPLSAGNDVAIVSFAADGSVAWAHGYRIETPVGHIAMHDVLPFGDDAALLVCRSYPANDPEELTMALAVVGTDGVVRGSIAVRGVDDLSLSRLSGGGYLARCAYGTAQLDAALQPLASWAGVDVREQGGRLWYLRRTIRGVAPGDVFGRLGAGGVPDWSLRLVGIAFDTEADFVGQADGSAVLAWSNGVADFLVATVRSDGSSADACAFQTVQDDLSPLDLLAPAVFVDADVLLTPDAPMAVPIASPVESVSVTATPDAPPTPSLPIVVPVCGG